MYTCRQSWLNPKCQNNALLLRLTMWHELQCDVSHMLAPTKGLILLAGILFPGESALTFCFLRRACISMVVNWFYPCWWPCWHQTLGENVVIIRFFLTKQDCWECLECSHYTLTAWRALWVTWIKCLCTALIVSVRIFKYPESNL